MLKPHVVHTKVYPRQDTYYTHSFTLAYLAESCSHDTITTQRNAYVGRAIVILWDGIVCAKCANVSEPLIISDIMRLGYIMNLCA